MSKAYTATATTVLVNGGPATLHGVWVVGGAGAGNVQLQDATASGGTVRAKFATPTAGGGMSGLRIGGGGIEFNTGILLKSAALQGVTIVYATGS